MIAHTLGINLMRLDGRGSTAADHANERDDEDERPESVTPADQGSGSCL